VPGPIVHRETDPQGKGRGSGLYYYRGKGEWSKYNTFRDAIIDRGPYKIGGGDYRHTNDYKTYDKAPSYPTNKKSYHHIRGPTVAARLRSLGRRA